MQVSHSTLFPCQACGRELPINLDRYPQFGGTFPCPNCKSPLTLPPLEEFRRTLDVALSPDPAAGPPARRVPQAFSAEPVSAGTSAAGLSEPEKPKPVETYRIFLPVGGTVEMTRIEVWQAIRRGELMGSTEVARLGSDDWKPMTAYPELARLLDQQARSVAVHPVAANVGIPAPLGRRFLAKVIDVLLLAIVFYPVQLSIERKLKTEMESMRVDARTLSAQPSSPAPSQPAYPPSYQPSETRRPASFGPMTQEEANRRQADAAWQRAQQMQREQQAGAQQQAEAERRNREEAAAEQVGRRFLALLFDVYRQAVVMSLLSQFLFVVLPLALTGASLGKLAMGLRVRRVDGRDIGFGQALGRTAAELLSGCLLYIGYLMALFDDERRTLHDRIAGTRVEPK